jgi:hypothetical protein
VLRLSKPISTVKKITSFVCLGSESRGGICESLREAERLRYYLNGSCQFDAEVDLRRHRAKSTRRHKIELTHTVNDRSCDCIRMSTGLQRNPRSLITSLFHSRDQRGFVSAPCGRQPVCSFQKRRNHFGNDTLCLEADFILQVVIPVRLKLDLSCLLWHWTWLYVPDVGGVFGDGVVAGEFSGARHIQNGLACPLLRVSI